MIDYFFSLEQSTVRYVEERGGFHGVGDLVACMWMLEDIANEENQ